MDAAKTGMLASSENIDAVAALIEAYDIQNLVVDPLMVATGGAKLLRSDSIDALCTRLLPLAVVITRNLPEAEVLLGRCIRTLAERREAARELVAHGPRAVLVMGDHADEDTTDVYWDGSEMVELPASRISTANTRGAIEFALEPSHGHVPGYSNVWVLRLMEFLLSPRPGEIKKGKEQDTNRCML
jgi:hydroxymethylpyrimidine/phosphomethylpyrimidine kinase